MISSRRKTAAVLAALAVTVTLAGASTASAHTGHQEARKPAVASVTGSATFELPYWKDKDVRSFSFDAHGAPYTRALPGAPQGMPFDAEGTVKVSHHFAGQNVTHTAEGRVDCLVTSPHTATLTAVITKVSPGGPDWVGKRMGFSVHDGGKGEPDRVGFSWNGLNLDDKGQDVPVGTCMAPAPYAPVVKGGYTVKHAELPSPPWKK
ncbi:hypothetical protein [Streptomyces sp. XH2]|uniref:hypothetical protein n=1 Tax=Streptomyces sp. XH2 TaxID=3412483 RepID=UPI003C7AB5B1